MELPKRLYPLDGYNMSELGDVLGVHKTTVRLHLKCSGVWDQTFLHRHQRLVPRSLARRILGLESDPPRTIDPVEFTYSLNKAAEMVGMSRAKLKKFLEETGLYKCCRRRSMRIEVPRSLILLIRRMIEERQKILEGKT